MKILVTGGAGFIASNIVDAYIELGHEVTVLDNLSTGIKEQVNPKAKFVLGDICDRELVTSLFSENQFEVIDHHAAHISIPDSQKRPTLSAEVNVVGTVNLLEQARSLKLVNFIFASTAATYGDTEVLPTPEDTPLNPVSPYGLTKSVGEQYLRLFHQNWDVPYTIFRYASAYGPRQRPEGEAGVVAIFSGKMVKGETPEIFNDGTSMRDYVYVKDLVRANVTVLEKPLNDVVNLSTAKETSVNELFASIKEILGVKIEPVYGRKTIEQKRSCLDYSKAKKLLGWSPKYSLGEGLKETLAWYRSNV
ncbi:MAG: NAD-dependent epimerase/dehydratase family protein [bacterium]|nr:NAD-dependent epimerase/dehydratase family protein [bacterium]